MSITVETSSPLAAMQAPSFMPGWGRDMHTSHGHNLMYGANTFGSGSFNFRDISMKKKPAGDYFGLNPVRGSSPTASLAADLSQNFHIDLSPPLPTPRRSLFTSNLFGTLDGRENVTTPPLPSSSPGPLHERMDISPLPHKLPFSAHVVVHSPSPAPTPDIDDVMASSPPQPHVVEAPKPVEFVCRPFSSDSADPSRRKKSILMRPSLTRTKGYSTNSMPVRATAEAQLPSFTFGAGSSKLSTSTSMSLGECFLESPPQERRPQSANSPSISMLGPPRPKLSFAGIGGHPSRNGSPATGHARRPSNPMMRPRKQFRRSLSMFESPGDVMQKKENTHQPLQSIMDVDDSSVPVLPHFFNEGQPDSIPRIAKSTLLEVLDGKYDADYDQRMVVDCRFEYEYEGGHINGAVNYNDKELLSSQLFKTALPGKTLLIFHCEYSAHRAPIMARYVRQQDRATNVEHYPKLTYPEVYILDGGYSSFYEQHRERCFPQNYVEMDAKEHAFTCEREMGRLRQNRTKLSRAQTFAFGQHEQYTDNSPTAASKLKTTSDILMLVNGSPCLDGRAQARRMASY